MRELYELGAKGALFRLWWEAKLRVPVGETLRPYVGDVAWRKAALEVFASARDVGLALPRKRANAGVVAAEADAAETGAVRCFGRWRAEFGTPIDWTLNPVDVKRWPADASWKYALRNSSTMGDIKFTWEIGRFPQMYALGRAAAICPERTARYAEVAARLFEEFTAANPLGLGVHWASGQEVAIRLIALVFARTSFVKHWAGHADASLASHAYESARFIDAHIAYARHAVHNNHLLGEALALYLCGSLLEGPPDLMRMAAKGRRLLSEGVDRQFYGDGGYVQQSHTYHRVALHYLLLASCVSRACGDAPDTAWLAAIERSIDFLYQQQDPCGGSLPNYGANDGAMILPLTGCDYVDFRPVLQAASLLTRGVRLYPSGPWDEEAEWLRLATEAPQIEVRRSRSCAFREAGHNVLRAGREDTFATFRCGPIRDRFTQIDMMHVDYWWRGHNVLVDAGSYSYNGPEKWHNHFFRTAVHNTVTVDGADQMLHYRRFKVLYRTRAKFDGISLHDAAVSASGEHYGYQRLPGSVVHSRSVVLFVDGTCVVLDRIDGAGEHEVTLHWLAGDFPAEVDDGGASVTLATPAGNVAVSVRCSAGPAVFDVVVGDENEPRGWQSRYYGERRPVPSIRLTTRSPLPIQFLTVIGPETEDVTWSSESLTVRSPGATYVVRGFADGVAEALMELR